MRAPHSEAPTTEVLISPLPASTWQPRKALLCPGGHRRVARSDLEKKPALAPKRPTVPSTQEIYNPTLAVSKNAGAMLRIMVTKDFQAPPSPHFPVCLDFTYRKGMEGEGQRGTPRNTSSNPQGSPHRLGHFTSVTVPSHSLPFFGKHTEAFCFSRLVLSRDLKLDGGRQSAGAMSLKEIIGLEGVELGADGKVRAPSAEVTGALRPRVQRQRARP